MSHISRLNSVKLSPFKGRNLLGKDICTQDSNSHIHSEDLSAQPVAFRAIGMFLDM